jgi:uncharacterized protein
MINDGRFALGKLMNGANMNMLALVREHREEILRFANLHGAKNLRIFGSAARHESSDQSDIDFLVELEAGRSLLDQVALQQELSELLNCPVDVVLDGGISPYLADEIQSDAVSL